MCQSGNEWRRRMRCNREMSVTSHLSVVPEGQRSVSFGTALGNNPSLRRGDYHHLANAPRRTGISLLSLPPEEGATRAVQSGLPFKATWPNVPANAHLLRMGVSDKQKWPDTYHTYATPN